MSIANIIYKYVVKGLAKNQGGITQLPTTQKITQAMEEIFQKLRDSGFNPVSAQKAIKNEDDLKRTLSEIDQAQMMEIKRRQDAAEGIETVIDKMNRGIPLNPGDQAKIEGAGMKTTLDAFRGFEPKVIEGGKGKKGIEELIEEGVVTKGTAPKTKPRDINQEIRDLVAADEAAMERAEDFKSFESRIRKASPSERVSERLNDLKGVTLEDLNPIGAQKIASEIIGRKGPFKLISSKGAKEILGELDKIIKEEDLGTKLKNFDGDPDAMAEGGLATMFRKK